MHRTPTADPPSKKKPTFGSAWAFCWLYPRPDNCKPGPFINQPKAQDDIRDRLKCLGWKVSGILGIRVQGS